MKRGFFENPAYNYIGVELPLGPESSPMINEVDQQVVTEALVVSEKGSSSIHPGDLLYEPG